MKNKHSTYKKLRSRQHLQQHTQTTAAKKKPKEKSEKKKKSSDSDKPEFIVKMSALCLKQ